MRARQRHFNPKNLGATLAFDSRFLSYNDNDLVDSWADRVAGVSYTATGTWRPTFKTSVSGGSPMVLSSASKRLSGNSTVYLPTLNANLYTFLFLGSGDNTSGDRVVMAIRGALGYEFLIYWNGSSSYWAFRNGSNGKRWTRPSANTVAIESFLNGTPYINGLAVSYTSHTHGGSENTNTICNIGVADASHRGYIGQLIIVNNQLTLSQLKRMTFSGAVAFKIPCS